jgi:hypothetical protein
VSTTREGYSPFFFSTLSSFFSPFRVVRESELLAVGDVPNTLDEVGGLSGVTLGGGEAVLFDAERYARIPPPRGSLIPAGPHGISSTPGVPGVRELRAATWGQWLFVWGGIWRRGAG